VEQRFVLALRISPRDVGARVSVRRRLPEGGMSDAVGRLLRWSDGTLSVARRDGTVTEIDESTLVAGKRVPPAPQRVAGGPARIQESARIRELERIAALGWPACRTATLGGWLLRASSGWTMRANSVLPLTPPGAGLDAALDFVEGWYGEQGLPAAFAIPDLLDDGLGPALDARGWPTTTRPIQMMVRALDADQPAPAAGGPQVRLAAAPDDDWLGCYRDRGTVPAAALPVLTGNQLAVFASVRVDGAVVAVGRATVDEGWLGISALETAPQARRTGLARQVIHALLEHGRSAGARRSYLQVAQDNVGAVALYRTAGFARHHGYHYRTAA
jgi:ribosomal protein S18 acetylase RimI-like enzyme